MSKTIDSPYNLIEMSDDELNKLLISEKYNEDNLRKLVIDCLLIIKAQDKAVKIHSNRAKALSDKLTRIKSVVNEDS